MAVGRTDGGVVLRVGEASRELERAEVRRLCDRLSATLTERREFLRTAGEHRADGSYVVERRAADSAGHRKVFESFDGLCELYERLPAEFAAEAVGRSGLTGGRRHMVLWHLAEHPAFDCELVARQPLTVRKAAAENDTAGEVASPGD